MHLHTPHALGWACRLTAYKSVASGSATGPGTEHLMVAPDDTAVDRTALPIVNCICLFGGGCETRSAARRTGIPKRSEWRASRSVIGGTRIGKRMDRCGALFYQPVDRNQ